MDKETAMKILGAKFLVPSAGKYTAEVNSISRYEDGQTAFIANVNLINSYQKAEATALFKAGEFQKACNKGLSISLKETDYIPGKRETVDVEVGLVTLKSGETALLAKSLIPRRAEAPTKSSWDFDEELVEESTSEDGDLA
tara:strand:+ start:224 stop:646 length:423 start_codon:yes stop_codon:yes gene_type:complete